MLHYRPISGTGGGEPVAGLHIVMQNHVPEDGGWKGWGGVWGGFRVHWPTDPQLD